MLYLTFLEPKHWKRWRAATEDCRRRLTEQQIVAGNPGTILNDVSTFLQFVGPAGIASQSRNASLPFECLPELNRKMSHTVVLALKRPLLRDYPNLAGIFILLRVMDLLQMKGNRLVVFGPALEAWRALNPTEQYFALLEALLFHSQSDVLGGHRTREEAQCIERVTIFLGHMSERWQDFRPHDSIGLLGPRGELRPWHLFTLQQLGLVELRPATFPKKQRAQWGGQGWLVGGARLTPWGTAVSWALLGCLKKGLDDEAEDAEDEEVAPPRSAQLELGETVTPRPSSATIEIDDGGDDDATESGEDESGQVARFGVLQPVFQPFFPEWQQVFSPPGRQVSAGMHFFKVTLGGWKRGDGGIWRRLAVPPKVSLEELAEAIRSVFNLEGDPLYDFTYRDQRGKKRVYSHPYSGEEPFTTDIGVGETDLALKDEMHFTFDYGDKWEFEVRLEAIDPKPTRARRITLYESAGKPPKQDPWE
jgi:hypothetical protein